jgi:hypothetical protein
VIRLRPVVSFRHDTYSILWIFPSSKENDITDLLRIDSEWFRSIHPIGGKEAVYLSKRVAVGNQLNAVDIGRGIQSVEEWFESR